MHATWNEFLSIVRDQVGSRVVETWFKAIIFKQWDPETKQAHLIAPNAFVRDWVKKHYLSLIQLHLGRLLHIEMPHVRIDASSDNAEPDKAAVSIVPAVMHKARLLMKAEKKRYGNLHKNYRFDNFVIGNHNSLAYAAAHAITEAPGKRYNPLFIYGESGLGKTHLLHAIGNEIKIRYQGAAILYQTADRFVSEFISAIRFNKVHNFQQKYHKVDLLLIDDVQFISRKEHTQEAFFHIFNTLYESRKQLVFSSDTYPHALEGVADRLRSRLACGLVTDIHLPSLETKIAILKKKASITGDSISDEVAHYIASTVTTNIRELEGALIRVTAFATLTKQEVTYELAQKVLQRAQSSMPEDSIVDLQAVITCVCKKYCITEAQLRSKERSKQLSQTRHIAMFLMKKLTDKSLRDIGTFLGGRDHSTVMHGLAKIEHAMQNDKAMFDNVMRIEREIRSTMKGSV